MQSMDRNTVIGFVLLGVLLFVYLFISSKSSRELQLKKQQYEDSVARVELGRKKALATTLPDSVAVPGIDSTATGWARATAGTETFQDVETDLFRIRFSNKGGQPVHLALKNYKRADSNLVTLIENGSDKLNYQVNIGKNQSAQAAELFFHLKGVEKDASGNQKITYEVIGSNGESISHEYTIKNGTYLIDLNLAFGGTGSLFTGQNLNLQWNVDALQQESDAKYERQQSQLVIVEDGEYDYFNLISSDQEVFEKNIHWASIKQQFFNSSLIAKDKFDNGKVEWMSPGDDSSKLIVGAKASFQKKLTGGNSNVVPLQFYFGPNDYKILRNIGVEKMDKIVNLGQGFYSFVRPINQYIVMPVFDFIKKFVGSYGIVIALLTLFIRLVTSPLVYSSYLSGAKMKALRPELDVLRAKHGDDQQAYGMDQMKLFREAGVNPLGGCIPALLQIPIFFALYSFFNANVALRGQAFLWADDLSRYDVIAKLPFSIPLGFGDHISLFTLLAVITSFLISIYNMNMTPDQNNPMLKYMPYIFPVILLVFFNRLPSALTWYYTVSNLITLALQFVIQNYIIDHDKIVAQLAENRSKPKPKSKWQERMEQMQATQKKMQEMQQKKGK
ncbi:membrane protein insertase YidC [Flavihumibacter solisilvae]|uniref:Membrane protein insertase YidC n=1 Tax=Flavihumibacter solisilvae TaxID=1349421 RepID=A0A0C1KZ67_9BACT|nr:membrane protein insertase YidC [Flavihumibacter solisilvae]KIC92992.1 membrane protein OxaA [Flavihumibacter solisilvae]